MGPGNMAECQRGPKVAPRLLLHAPLAPCRFLQGGPRARAISQSVSRNLAECFARGRRVSLQAPKGGASVVVYIPNGTVWTQENFVEIFEKTQQVGYRCLAGTPSRAGQRSNSWKFCSSICSSIWSRIRATFGAALALCEICVSGNAHFQ